MPRPHFGQGTGGMKTLSRRELVYPGPSAEAGGGGGKAGGQRGHREGSGKDFGFESEWDRTCGWSDLDPGCCVGSGPRGQGDR